MEDIDFRVREFSMRPEAIAKMNSMLNSSNVFLDNLKNLTGEGRIFTQAEFDSLNKLIVDATVTTETPWCIAHVTNG